MINGEYELCVTSRASVVNYYTTTTISAAAVAAVSYTVKIDFYLQSGFATVNIFRYKIDYIRQISNTDSAYYYYYYYYPIIPLTTTTCIMLPGCVRNPIVIEYK